MAFRAQNFARLLRSTSITALSHHNTAARNIRAFLILGPISNSADIRHPFSTDQTHSHRKLVSHKHEEEVASNNLEFQKWKNGGGMFHKSALIDPTVTIEVGALVHPESVVGPNVFIGSGTVIGPAVRVGQSVKLGYNVALTNCMIGDFCVIHNGVCIGQDGFGFFVNEQGQMVKKPQNLNTRIGNHVEIGANTCIDRGSWRDTTIGDHTKIDNLVQIGHNVEIGKNCMLCGQVGIAGSVTIGDYVTLGGRVAIRDHVCIASKVRLAANSCVTKNINESGDYGGFPVVPIREWRKQIVTLRQNLGAVGSTAKR